MEDSILNQRLNSIFNYDNLIAMKYLVNKDNATGRILDGEAVIINKFKCKWCKKEGGYLRFLKAEMINGGSYN